MRRWLTAVTLAALSTPALAGAPALERWETGAGVPVVYVHAPELPIADVRLVFDAGSVRDGDRPGTAELTSRVLDYGAGGLDADEFARRLEDTGARLSTDVSRNGATVHLRTLTEPEAFDGAVELLERLLAAPELPDEAVARERARMRSNLRAERQSASAVARRALYEAIYGDHPFATPPAGTDEGVDALDRAAVADFHARHYTAAAAVVAIVGDLEREAAEALAERLTGALPAGEALPEIPEVPAEPATREVRIDFPGHQTTILLGTPVTSRADERYLALRLGNHVLGGSGMVSRLFVEMRERRGLSYSTYSFVDAGRVRGPLVVGSQVRADRQEEARELMRGILEAFLAEGPGEEELEDARRNLTGGFPLQVESNSALVGQASVIAFYRLPDDYLATYVDALEALTGEQVHAAFRERVDPERLVTVLVGPGVEDGE